MRHPGVRGAWGPRAGTWGGGVTGLRGGPRPGSRSCALGGRSPAGPDPPSARGARPGSPDLLRPGPDVRGCKRWGPAGAAALPAAERSLAARGPALRTVWEAPGLSAGGGRGAGGSGSGASGRGCGERGPDRSIHRGSERGCPSRLLRAAPRACWPRGAPSAAQACGSAVSASRTGVGALEPTLGETTPRPRPAPRTPRGFCRAGKLAGRLDPWGRGAPRGGGRKGRPVGLGGLPRPPRPCPCTLGRGRRDRSTAGAGGPRRLWGSSAAKSAPAAEAVNCFIPSREPYWAKGVCHVLLRLILTS